MEQGVNHPSLEAFKNRLGKNGCGFFVFFLALIFPVELEEFSQPEVLQFSKSRGKYS